MSTYQALLQFYGQIVANYYPFPCRQALMRQTSFLKVVLEFAALHLHDQKFCETFFPNNQDIFFPLL